MPRFVSSPRGAVQANLRQLPEIDVTENTLEHYRTLLNWSEMREQPPRCLRCGDANFTPLERVENCLVEMGTDGPMPFRHPRCGGGFKLKAVSFDQPVVISLTADGQPIGRRWDGSFVRWVRRFFCWVSSRFSEREK